MASAVAPSGLADALFSKVRQRVLGYLFGQPGRSYYANELIGLVGCGNGAVQRELKQLEASGLVTATRVGNQKHYQANPSSPLFEELCNIAVKTFGLTVPIQEALLDLSDQIQAAFVFGSVAKELDTAGSDVDLMVISDSLTYGDLFLALEDVSRRLGRTVNPTIYSLHEFQRRLDENSAFAARVMVQPRIFVVGSERALSASPLDNL